MHCLRHDTQTSQESRHFCGSHGGDAEDSSATESNSRCCVDRSVLLCGSRNPRMFTYLLTPWSRVLLEKLTDSQLLKKLTSFYGTRRYINRTHKCPLPASSLSQIDPVHSPTSHFLKNQINIILPFTTGSPKCSPTLRNRRKMCRLNFKLRQPAHRYNVISTRRPPSYKLFIF